MKRPRIFRPEMEFCRNSVMPALGKTFDCTDEYTIPERMEMEPQFDHDSMENANIRLRRSEITIRS